MATVGRPSNSDANFFASLQDHSHDDSQPSEAEPAEKTRTPQAPVQRASGPALSRWGLQDHARADRCLLKIRADQVPPTVFRAMGLAGDSFAGQLLTITSVPQIDSKGVVTRVCRITLQRAGGDVSVLFAPLAACLPLGIGDASIQVAELMRIFDRCSDLTEDDGKALFLVLQAERGNSHAHIFPRAAWASFAAVAKPTADQVRQAAQCALNSDSTLADTAMRGETSSIWILDRGHCMVLQGHFSRRIVYGANSYQDNRGDYNSSLKVVGMKALVLFQAVQGICEAAKSANVAASAELWRYQPRHQKRQSDSVSCSLLSALNAFAIDSGDREGGVLNPHEHGGCGMPQYSFWSTTSWRPTLQQR